MSTVAGNSAVIHRLAAFCDPPHVARVAFALKASPIGDGAGPAKMCSANSPLSNLQACPKT